MQFHPVGVQILGVFVNAAPLLAQLHNRADVLVGVKMLAFTCGSSAEAIKDGRVVGGVVDGDDRTIGQVDFVDNAGCCGYQIEIKFPLQPLLDNFHVQKPQKPQRKPKPSAMEVSGSKESDASFSCNFSRRPAGRDSGRRPPGRCRRIPWAPLCGSRATVRRRGGRVRLPCRRQ